MKMANVYILPSPITNDYRLLGRFHIHLLFVFIHVSAIVFISSFCLPQVTKLVKKVSDFEKKRKKKKITYKIIKR